MDNEKLAIAAIKKYLNKLDSTDEEILAKYSYAIELVKSNIVNSINRDSNISAITEGSRSVTFTDIDRNSIIDSKVKAVLPNPFIKMW